MTDNRSLTAYQAPPPPTLIDSRGRPLRSATDVLTREIGGPTMAGVRSVLSGHPAQGLDPLRLTQILRAAETGDATAYLELAEEMEEKDLHYLSVLGTRKRAVSQLPVEVEAAGEGPEYEGDAQLVRDWLKRQTLQAELFDILDAIGKGYSATEIVWNMTGDLWLPSVLTRQDPRFFEYDRDTGKQLLLKGGIDGYHGLAQPLPQYKFIVHEAAAKSGLPIRGGLARAVAWIYLFKNFTLKDWMTFLEVYGLPLRVGKYQNGTSEEDIRKLARAVAQIGSDAGCVIPASMQIDFITSQGGAANPEMFQALCTYGDELISKAVLGQTSSSDAKAGGLGSGQADLHGDVQHLIECSDAVQLSATGTRDLVIPMVMFNRGVRDKYPLLKIGRPDPVDVKSALEAMDKGVALGVPIPVSHYRKVTGIPEPKAGEAILVRAAAPQSAQEPAQAPNGPDVPREPATGPLVAPLAPESRLQDRTGDAVPAAVLIDAKYNASQPRVPRGSKRGGEWSDGRGGGPGFGGAMPLGGGGGGGGAGGAPVGGGGGASPETVKPGKLTRAEANAVSDYSLMDYKLINEQARGEADYGAKTKKKVEVMDRAVAKSRLSEDAVLYRGVSGPGVEALKRAGISEGSVIRDPGFLSTSRSRDVAVMGFAEAKGSILIAITAKKGSKALDAAPHSNLRHEQEVIFPRSAKLRVTKWDKRTRTLHVEAEDD
ncbi:phage portal protein family protein [Sphingomonas hengshuiensis]|uniref:phage portal protein family protein n=1 Tax=Sphingomonas hengshuiensis TaxID=1609977 RepID=UPI000696997D|nr:DUF935 family protein [Sphingomonas hengshuiensis]